MRPRVNAVNDRAVSLRRGPHAEPAVTKPRRPLEGGISAAADQDRDGLLRGGFDPALVKLEELAVVIHRFAAEQPLDDLEAFVRATAAAFWIDTTHGDFIAIFTAHANPEQQLAGGRFSDGYELSGDRYRMPQRQQIDPDTDLEPFVDRGQRGGVDQSIHAGADVEADVVGDEDMIDTAVQNPGDQITTPLVRRLQQGG